MHKNGNKNITTFVSGYPPDNDDTVTSQIGCSCRAGVGNARPLGCTVYAPWDCLIQPAWQVVLAQKQQLPSNNIHIGKEKQFQSSH